MPRFLFFLIFPALLAAQKEDYVDNYEQYAISNGLSHNHVYQSYKDSRGIQWIITAHGLTRFDGSQFKFIPQVEITDTQQAKIFLEDRDGEIWIGSPGQPLLLLNIFNEEVRTAREKFGKQFPEQVLSAIKGISNTYLVQTAIDEAQRFTPGKGQGKRIKMLDLFEFFITKCQKSVSFRSAATESTRAGRNWRCLFQFGLCRFRRCAPE